jgi:hypothetical protein
MLEGASLFQLTGKYCSVETEEKLLLFKKIHLKNWPNPFSIYLQKGNQGHDR